MQQVGLMMLLAMSLWAGSAMAEAEFVEPFMEASGMECVPPCITCHNQPDGGKNWNAFGIRVLGQVAGKSHPNFETVVQKLKTPDADSDMDGVLDFQELVNGTFPAKASTSPGGDRISCPRYGCGARIAPRKSGSGTEPLAASAAGLTAALLMIARRARSKKR